jgi:hypothetical protein
MRFWASISLLAILGTSTLLLAQTRVPAYRHDLHNKHTNEWRLASTQPGLTTLAKAQRILGKPSLGNDYQTTWHSCSQKELVIDSDKKGIVQSIRVSRVSDEPPLDCVFPASNEAQWKTGLGLEVDDSASHVIELYGQPTSRSPSTKGNQQLELLYYAFDWAGADVPQVMEVLCTPEKDGKPGRVVEITLAAPSL